MRNSYTRTGSRQRSSKSAKKRIWLLAGGIVVLLIAVGALLEFTNTINLFGDKVDTVATTANSETKGEPQDETVTEQPSGQTPAPSQADKPSGGDAPVNPNATLLEPSGDFVNTHHPNLSGAPASNQMQSVCSTTPGATCQISFTKGGVTKSLTAQKTDSGGATYWTWKLQDIGLTEGSWEVKATATLNGGSKTTIDALKLEVAS